MVVNCVLPHGPVGAHDALVERYVERYLHTTSKYSRPGFRPTGGMCKRVGAGEMDRSHGQHQHK